jgi:sigma-E factor negative regulatory protein RseC
MNTSVCIEQKGIVDSVAQNEISVRIDRSTACGQCDVYGICNLGHTGENIIEIPDESGRYSVGDPVTITITRSMGNRAIGLGYLFPFLLLLSVLIIMSLLSLPEWICGLAALTVLIPYYFTLFLFRKRLSRKFTFTVSKMN